MEIAARAIAHYNDVIELMRSTPGVRVRSSDSCEATRGYSNFGFFHVAMAK